MGEYQLHFQSKLQKLHEGATTLPKDIQLSAFFYGMEEKYSQWLYAKRSYIQSKAKDGDLLTIEDLTAKLLHESHIRIAADVKAPAVSNTANGCRISKKLRTRCIFCEKEGHEEDNCWKKYSKQRPARMKHQDFIDHSSINQAITDD